MSTKLLPTAPDSTDADETVTLLPNPNRGPGGHKFHTAECRFVRTSDRDSKPVPRSWAEVWTAGQCAACRRRED